jgi:hypothetical protein
MVFIFGGGGSILTIHESMGSTQNQTHISIGFGLGQQRET